MKVAGEGSIKTALRAQLEKVGLLHENGAVLATGNPRIHGLAVAAEAATLVMPVPQKPSNTMSPGSV